MKRKIINIKVNGQSYEIYVKCNELLVQVIRDRLGFTGTKRGCQDASCGACTIIMNGMTVKACSVLAPQANGAEILTAEGLANGPNLSSLQKAFLDYGAYQCGFCTSGMLMSSTALLMETPKPSKEEIKEAIDGNVCRCTGYNAIIRAINAVARGEYGEDR